MGKQAPQEPERRQAARIRFDRNEWAGSFGDLGTDLPLIVAVTLAAGLDGASVLTLFGIMQILSALRYRLPMPVQPLKAMAAIVIAQGIPGPVLLGGGLAIGVVMLCLTLTGTLDWLARVVPKSVVRGIQLGLGLKLAALALEDYIPAAGTGGLVLGATCFLIAAILYGNRRLPAALLLIPLGVAYALAFEAPAAALQDGFGFQLPQTHLPAFADILTGFVLLTIPQLPLSLGNSVLATHQIAKDYFPGREPKIRQIGITYSIMNLVTPFFSGIPTCHGSGGFAGHYAFGGRTGGSVIIYGAFFLTAGLFFGQAFDVLVQVFPLPLLGVLLFFEGLALIVLSRDMVPRMIEFRITLAVGLTAAFLPYGFVAGMILGMILEGFHKAGILLDDSASKSQR